MLQSVKAEIRHPCRIGMPVNGNHAALFTQLVALMVCHSERGIVVRRCRAEGSAFQRCLNRLRTIFNTLDPLKQQPAHAVTSLWSAASRDLAHGSRTPWRAPD